MVAPHLLDTRVRHQPAGVVRLHPAFAIEREPALGDQHMYVWMPLQVGPERVEDRDEAHAHAVLLACPLVETRCGRTREQPQSDLAVQQNDRTQLPRRREHQVMIRDLEQIVQHPIRPAIGRVLAARRTEARLARVRHHRVASALRALVQMTPERGRTTCAHLSHRLDHDRPDPAAIRQEELLPVGCQDRRDAVADLRSDRQHGGKLSTLRPDRNGVGFAPAVAGR